MRVTEEMFLATIDKYFLDVREEALALFRDGVPHDRVLDIAMKVAAAKAEARARAKQEFGLIPQ
jgi:hypothetical protein